MSDERILANLIARQAAEHPDLDVLTFVDVKSDGGFAEEVRSFRELRDNGQRVAQALGDAGMQAGDRFALLMQNHPEFVDAMVGSSIAGTVFVPIDPRTRGEKLAFMLGFSGCRGVICADYALGHLMAVIRALPQIRWVWVLRTGAVQHLHASGVSPRWLDEVLPVAVPALPVAVDSPEQTMQMLFTSGTTGDPKAILANYLRFHAVGSIGPLIGWSAADVFYTGLSLTHANAQLITLGNVLTLGARGVISRRFTKSRLWDICRRYGCTTFNLLGGMTTAVYS